MSIVSIFAKHIAWGNRVKIRSINNISHGPDSVDYTSIDLFIWRSGGSDDVHMEKWGSDDVHMEK